MTRQDAVNTYLSAQAELNEWNVDFSFLYNATARFVEANKGDWSALIKFIEETAEKEIEEQTEAMYEEEERLQAEAEDRAFKAFWGTCDRD
tara:strand:+ start:267 stop:539 length:273 start_codon:yes stop_codon:yes gene_type:complete